MELLRIVDHVIQESNKKTVTDCDCLSQGTTRSADEGACFLRLPPAQRTPLTVQRCKVSTIYFDALECHHGHFPLNVTRGILSGQTLHEFIILKN